MSSTVEAYSLPPAERSAGVWGTAWRRLTADRVGMVSLAIVMAFLVMILASVLGLVARDWQKEVGVPDAPPSFVGPRAAQSGVDPLTALVAKDAKPVDLSDIDPLAPKYQEWNERAAKIQIAQEKRAETLVFGGDRLGRDVLDKVIKGAEVSIFVGVFAAVLATLIGTMLGALAGYAGGRTGDLLEWVYNVFTSIPGILLIFAFAAVLGRGISTVILILGLAGWTGIYRLVRAEYMKHRSREYVRAAEAIGASAFLAHVRAHPAQRQPRGAGAAVAACRLFHQGRGDPVLPRAGCARRPGVVGNDAVGSAGGTGARPLVAAGSGDDLDGDLRYRVFAADRRAARRARSEAEIGRCPVSNLISVRDLRVSFRLGKHRIVEAVRGISFDVPENSTVALVGESGSGKSVSAMSIVRLLPENAIVDERSRVEFGGRNLLTVSDEEVRAIRGKDISVVFQEPMTSLNPVFTVGWQIAEVLLLHTRLTGRQVRERVIELLNEVGIPEPKSRVDAYPHELSGGQQQRVMIAMAIACEPKLLIADEPTTALDVTVQRQILELIQNLQDKHRMSVLFISHDLGLVGEIADSVVVMREGEVRESGPVDRIFDAPQDAYTKALLLCRPRLDVKPKRLPVIDDFMQWPRRAERSPAKFAPRGRRRPHR